MPLSYPISDVRTHVPRAGLCQSPIPGHISLPFFLPILGAVQNPVAPPGITPISLPLAPLILPPTRPKMLPIDSAADCHKLRHVELVQVLQRSASSQVYRARVLLRGHPLQRNAVVKLFQWSLSDEGRCAIAEDRSEYDGMARMCGSVLAQREGWAYERMQALQGNVVPHSFGFYAFEVPPGEHVVGHIMEEIRGLTPFEYGKRIGTDEGQICGLADAIVWAVHAVHCAGVVHGDIHDGRQPDPGNMLIQTVNGTLTVVLLDFAEAGRLQDAAGRCRLPIDGVGVRDVLFAATAPEWSILESRVNREHRYFLINKWARGSVEAGKPWALMFNGMWDLTKATLMRLELSYGNLDRALL